MLQCIGQRGAAGQAAQFGLQRLCVAQAGRGRGIGRERKLQSAADAREQIAELDVLGREIDRPRKIFADGRQLLLAQSERQSRPAGGPLRSFAAQLLQPGGQPTPVAAAEFSARQLQLVPADVRMPMTLYVGLASLPVVSIVGFSPARAGANPQVVDLQIGQELIPALRAGGGEALGGSQFHVDARRGRAPCGGESRRSTKAIDTRDTAVTRTCDDHVLALDSSVTKRDTRN